MHKCKKIGIIILATLMLLAVSSVSFAETGTSLEQACHDIVSYYENHKTTLDSWEEVVGLSQAGVDLTSGSWQLPDWKADSLNDSSSSADYARTIIGMLAAGQNPRDVSGRDLANELVHRQTANGDFGGAIYNTIWSMVALDTARVDYDVSGAAAYLLDQKTSDGGFAFSGDKADADITGFALMALAPHTGIDGVSDAITQAQQCLKNMQMESGGFASWGTESAESTAAVIRGLVVSGVDITADEWKKNDHTMIDALFNFQLADKSFSHTLDGNSDAMATQQALIAVADMVRAGVKYNLGQGGNSGSGPDEETSVRVRVEGATQSLADEVVTVTGTAMDALKAAVGEANVTAPGGFITAIKGESGRNGVAENIDTSWCYYVIRDGAIEPSAFDKGAANYNVKDGDEVVFYIGAYDNTTWASKTFFPVVSVSPVSPTAGQTLTIDIAAQKYVWREGLQPLSAEEASAVGSYSVRIGEAEFTSFYGQVTIPDVTQGILNFSVTNANEAGYPDVVSFKGKFTVGEPANAQVKVRVEGATSSLHDSTVTVSGTAMDALKAAVGEANVTAPGGFITAIKGESGQNGVAEDTDTSWCYYVIRDGAIEPGAFDEGAASYNVKDGDEVVFYIGACDNTTWASKTFFPVVSVSPVSPTAGQTLTIDIAAQKYVWREGLQPLTAEEATAVGNYTVVAGGQEYTSQSGQVTIPDVNQGVLDFTITNANEAGYPDVVSFKGNITVGSSGGSGGGSQPVGTTVEIAVVGKTGNLMFGPGSVTVLSSDRFGETAMGALDKTGLSWSFSPDWDGLIIGIDGISNQGMNGWMYKVNGGVPMVLPRDKSVGQGDRIIFWYSDDAASSGPSWSDIVSGNWAGAGSGAGQADDKALAAVKETLAGYSSQLAGLKEQNQILNADKKMTPEKVQNLKEEIGRNTVSLRQEVGQTGRVLADARTEVALLIPPNALNQTRTITIEELSASKQPTSAGIKIGSSIYEFGPQGIKFAQPVTISLKVAITEDMDIASLTPAWYDEEKGEWVPIPGVIDLQEGLVVFQIDHFTRFAVVELVDQTEVLAPVAQQPRRGFADVDDRLAWARDAIEILAGQGIIQGTGKGFEPHRTITRAEFIQLMVTALGLQSDQNMAGHFSDVCATDWFATAVGCAYKHNIIAGYADGSFKPNHNITRNEIAVIFYRLEKTAGDKPGNNVLKDLDQIPAWALDAVKYVNARGLMQGYEDQTFRGNRPLTRAEAAVVLFNYLNTTPGLLV